VCRRIGVFDPLDDLTGRSCTASEFEDLPPMQQAVAIQKLSLFSRVEPSHKSMLVEALKNQNEVVSLLSTPVSPIEQGCRLVSLIRFPALRLVVVFIVWLKYSFSWDYGLCRWP
jgi:hypothetical protein